MLYQMELYSCLKITTRDPSGKEEITYKSLDNESGVELARTMDAVTLVLGLQYPVAPMMFSPHKIILDCPEYISLERLTRDVNNSLEAFCCGDMDCYMLPFKDDIFLPEEIDLSKKNLYVARNLRLTFHYSSLPKVVRVKESHSQ